MHIIKYYFIYLTSDTWLSVPMTTGIKLDSDRQCNCFNQPSILNQEPLERERH
jgi:hypothetical protein